MASDSLPAIELKLMHHFPDLTPAQRVFFYKKLKRFKQELEFVPERVARGMFFTKHRGVYAGTRDVVINFGEEWFYYPKGGFIMCVGKDGSANPLQWNS